MKNKKIYLLFSLFLLILNVRVVKAFVTPSSEVIELREDEEKIFASTLTYGDDLVCTSGTKFKVTPNANGDYVAEYTGSVTEGTDEEEISCTSSEVEGGTFKVKLMVDITPEEPSEVSVILCFNPTKTTDNLKNHVSGFKKLGENISGTGKDAVKASCHEGDSDCLFTADETTESLYYSFKTYYYDTNDKKVNLTVYIQVEPSKIIIDFSGTCSSLNGWTKSAGTKYEAVYTTSLKLPSNCVASNNPFKKLTGWRAVVGTARSGCNEANPEYKPGQTFAYPEGTVNLQSCYTEIGGFRLSYSKGTISNTGGWTQEPKNSKAFYSVSTSAKLPNITPNEGEEFAGWKNTTTGETVAAGTTVNLDASNPSKSISFVAMYKNKIADEVDEKITGTASQMVRVGTSDILIKGFDDSSVCTGSYTYYKLEVVGRDCLVTGIKETTSLPKGVVTKQIKSSDGKKTYDVTVMVLKPDDGFIQTNSGEVTRVVDNKPSIVTQLSVDKGKEYLVKKRTSETIGYITRKKLLDNLTGNDSSKAIEDLNYLGVTEDSKSYGVIVSVFDTKEKNCGSSSCPIIKSVCLDPGRDGPEYDWMTYVVNSELNLSNKFDAGLYAMATLLPENPSNEDAIAIDIAARVWTIVQGNGGGHSSYHANYGVYKALVNYMAKKSGKNDAKLLSTIPWTDLITGTSSNMVSKINKYYKAAYNATQKNYVTSNMKVTITKEDEHADFVGTGSSKYIRYTQTGTVTFPAGTSNPKITAQCNQTGYECNATAPILTKIADDKYHYRVEIIIQNNASTPKKENLKFRIDYDNNKAISSGFILYKAGQLINTYQRMLVLAEGEQFYELEIYPNVNIGHCDESVTSIPQYNWRLACGESENVQDCIDAIDDGDFNAIMFNKMGCCENSDIVENKNSIAYKYICGGEYTCIDENGVEECKRKNCTSGSIAEACLNDDAAAEHTDVYQINEGVDASGKEDYSCLVELKYSDEKNNHEATENIVDSDNNQIAVKEFIGSDANPDGNDYCRVTCKEDWYFTSPSYKNFTGENSIPAGGVLKISSPIFVAGKKTCITSTIDIEGFEQDLSEAWKSSSLAQFEYENNLEYYEKANNGTLDDVINLTDDRGIKLNVADYESKEAYYDAVKMYAAKKMDEAKTTIATNESLVTAAIEQLNQCQSLGFSMDADEDIVRKTSGVGNLLNIGGSVKVKASFNPNVTFQYEDEEHNKQMLEKDSNGITKNTWIPDIETNKKYNPNYFTDGTLGDPIKEIKNKDADSEALRINNPTTGDTNLYAVRNKYEVKYYKDKKKKANEAYAGGNEIAEGSIETKNMFRLECNIPAEGVYTPISCSTTNDIQYKNYHYAKISVENSSFFKNKYGWYETPENHVLHEITGDTITIGKMIYMEIGGGEAFPIAFDARRGFYQYAFTYANIGQFNDGTNGRLLGGKETPSTGQTNPTRNNAVACFYEVYEAICGCCGEPIESEVYDNGAIIEGDVETQNYLDGGYTSDYGSSVSIESENNNNIDNTDDESSYKYKNYNTGGNKQNGTLRLVTTPVSLSDVSGFYNDDNSVNIDNIAANWAEGNDYTVGNTRFETDKGAELLGAIRENGEIIYDKNPEYSYNLTPQSISAIKAYNLNKGYGIQDERLETEGMYVRNIGGYNSPADGGDASVGGNFTHYGSKFLSEIMKSYTNNKPGKDLCYVATGEVGKIYSDSKYSSTNCRWVDYYNTDDGTMLAFK